MLMVVHLMFGGQVILIACGRDRLRLVRPVAVHLVHLVYLDCLGFQFYNFGPPSDVEIQTDWFHQKSLEPASNLGPNQDVMRMR